MLQKWLYVLSKAIRQWLQLRRVSDSLHSYPPMSTNHVLSAASVQEHAGDVAILNERTLPPHTDRMVIGVVLRRAAFISPLRLLLTTRYTTVSIVRAAHSSCGPTVTWLRLTCADLISFRVPDLPPRLRLPDDTEHRLTSYDPNRSWRRPASRRLHFPSPSLSNHTLHHSVNRTYTTQLRWQDSNQAYTDLRRPHLL